MIYPDFYLAQTLGMEPHTFVKGDITIRLMRSDDFPSLVALSTMEFEPEIKLFRYVTLVAARSGILLGYTQFYITIDGILHSAAIRIGVEHKGLGIGAALMNVKEQIAIKAGAHLHIYAVAKNGEIALKKILEKQGMHACQHYPEFIIYMKDLKS